MTPTFRQSKGYLIELTGDRVGAWISMDSLVIVAHLDFPDTSPDMLRRALTVDYQTMRDYGMATIAGDTVRFDNDHE